MPYTRVAAALLFSLTLLPGSPLAVGSSAPAAKAGGVKKKEAPSVESTAWKEIDRLIDELKLTEASEHLDKLLPRLRESGDAEAWMRGLIRGAQLRANIAQPEEAAIFLQSQPWPEGRRQHAILSLFYAEALKNYYDNYRWTIWKQEAVQSDKPADLKVWTTGQVFEAASKAYLEAWKDREILGGIQVSELPDYLHPNNYPKGVRGTLRDAVSYFWVELLADTGYWSPAWSNATGHFDLVAMFRGGEIPEDKLEEGLADPGIHPLVRAVTVLGELERWHTSQGTRGGALEARLERIRRLRNHALPAEMDDLRKALEAFLPAYKDVSWWAMGMAELAGLYQSHGDLPEAVAAARAGAKAWPDTPGAEQCLVVVKAIEAPSYRIQILSSDGLKRRSIEVTHKNLSALWFRAYPVDLEARLKAAGSIFPLRDEDLRKLVPAFAWKSDLPATPDYREHATFITPPIDRRGAYVVTASVRQGFGDKDNQVTAVPFVVGDLAVLAQSEKTGDAMEVAVLTGEDGEPVAGAEVTLYAAEAWQKRSAENTRTTDEAGRVRFELGSGQGYVIAARKGKDIGVIQSMYVPEPPEGKPGIAALVFTDRSIYRPQQKVLWKVLVYEDQGNGRLQGSSGTSVSVSLVDPNDQAVGSQTVTTNGFGTAAGEFMIPAGRPLGDWRIETSREGEASIRVEEYKRPTFEVSLDDPKEPLRLGHPAAFTGTARYYFGLPVTHGEVRWRAVRQPVYSWFWLGEESREETVATGTAELAPDGTFAVTFTPDPGDPKGRDRKHLSYRYKVTADLTDEGGETRTAQRSFRLGWVSIEAEIAPDSNLFIAGEAASVTIHRRDLDGIGRAGTGTWKLVALRQPAETATPADLPRPPSGDPDQFHTAGDRLRPRGETDYKPDEAMRLWEDGPQIASGTVQHDGEGEASLTLPELTPGAYRLLYETADAAGEVFSVAENLIIAGPETPLALAAVLKVDSSAAHPGGRVRVLAHSGFPDQLVQLETWRSGVLVKRLPLRMGRDANLLDIPIGPEDRGGFSLRLVMLRDHQLVELAEHVYVPWTDRALAVDVATFRDRIRPGGRETWTVTVKPAVEPPAPGQPPAEGQPVEAVAAELLASMYDRSLDLFAPHNPPDPLNLYPNRMGVSGLESSLRQLYAGWIRGSGLERYHPGPDLRQDELRFRQAFREEMADAMRVEGGVEGGVVGGVAGGTPGGVPAPPPPPPSPQSAKMAAKPEALSLATDRISVGEPEPAAPAPETALRSDFSETAFWQPQLLTGPDGTAAIEFTVPDSVTSWKLWVRAITRDLRAGSLEREVDSVKDLMVRPYLPRFLREGDRAELEVVVNNASEKELRGELVLDVLEPGTDDSRLADFGLDPSHARAAFTVAAGSGTSVRFPLTAPRRVGPVAFKVTATAGGISDGELRPLPILPSRMHLVQSRFVALPGNETKEMRFADMTKPDATRIDEQLVVTLDAQLFYSVLEALPYLVDYPYECTEQTLNRFLSTGIVASLYDKYPAVATMARQLAKRDTQYEAWDSVDPNRKMALEETPWLQVSQGGEQPSHDLIKVLDERVARAQRDSALTRLQQAQLDNGAFPWWPGGPPSPYMTIYLLYGFAKAAEYGLDLPKENVQKAWAYLADYYRTEEKPRLADRAGGHCCRELLVFLNYVATAFPDESWMGKSFTRAERKEILDDSFAHWKELSGTLQALLAITLQRSGRPADAKLVFGRILDMAKTTPEEGTFWSPEPHAWLWYEDNIETHAFALLATMEIAPDDPRRHGMVQWLFLNKQLNHWKSTRATAEVLYALVHYLEKEGQLAVKESATVQVAGQAASFTFEPDHYTGKHNQVIVPGEKMDPATASRVVVSNEGPSLMFASATWHFSTEELPKEARGDLFGVTRRYFLRSATADGFALKPLDEGIALRPGDEVEVQLTFTSRSPAEYVHLRDPRPAGLEPEDAKSGYKWDPLAPGRYEEIRDSGTNFFFDWLPAGEYTLKYRLRANLGGTFRTGPATLQSMYAPEFTAYSAGDVVTVAPLKP